MSNLLPVEELSRQARAQGQFVIPCSEFTELVGALRRLVNRKLSKSRYTGKPLSKSTIRAQEVLEKHKDRIRAIHWPREKTA